MAMAYLYLAAAILFEVLGTVTMKYIEGFTKGLPIILTLVCHGICFVALAAALKSLPMSMVYSIWAGVGTAAMALVGIFIFNEPLPLQKVFATGLIVLGVILLNSSLGVEKKVDQLASVESQKVQLEKPVEVPIVAQRNSG